MGFLFSCIIVLIPLVRAWSDRTQSSLDRSGGVSVLIPLVRAWSDRTPRPQHQDAAGLVLIPLVRAWSDRTQHRGFSLPLRQCLNPFSQGVVRQDARKRAGALSCTSLNPFSQGVVRQDVNANTREPVEGRS